MSRVFFLIFRVKAWFWPFISSAAPDVPQSDPFLRGLWTLFQMSFSKILASSLMLSNGEIVRSPRSFPTREIEQDRRYFQLVAFMKHYNREFDERKYWTYGCNCHVLGDRPMSDPGFGPPVDKLDSVCKQYKDCNKCAREKFGESCIGELVEYRYGETVSFSWRFLLHPTQISLQPFFVNPSNTLVDITRIHFTSIPFSVRFH